MAPAGRLTLGFRAPRSHALVEVERCVVADDQLTDALEPLREAIAARGPGQGEANLLSGAEGVAAWIRPASGAPWRWGPETVSIQAGDYTWSASPDLERIFQPKRGPILWFGLGAVAVSPFSGG